MIANRRKVLVTGIAALSFQLVTMSRCTAETSTPPTPDGSLGQENATWARSTFFRGYAPTSGAQLLDSDVPAFAQLLGENGIKYVYPFSGPFQPDGTLPPFTFSDRALKSLKAMKAANPTLKVLPWVGGIQGKTVSLQDRAWRAHALDAVAKLVETVPIDGIHLDFELILGGDRYLQPLTDHNTRESDYVSGLIAFHREARARFPKLFISSVVVSTAPDTKPWKLKHTIPEILQIAAEVNQLSFLYYDTSIHDAATYKQNLHTQIDQFVTIKNSLKERAPQLLLAIGTFINEPELRAYRDLEIENNSKTLKMLRDDLAERRTSFRIVDGIAIYCEWLTDESEWREFRDAWVKK